MDLVAAASVLSGFAAALAVVLAAAQWARQRSGQAAEQARLVFTQLDQGSTAAMPLVRLHNDSSKLITHVRVRIPGDETNAHYISMVAPHDFTTVSVALSNLVPAPGWFVLNVGCGGPASPTEPVCDVRFTDFRGKTWQRIGTDRPRRLWRNQRLANI